MRALRAVAYPANAVPVRLEIDRPLSWLRLKIDLGQCLPVAVADDEARVCFLDGPGRREAALRHGGIKFSATRRLAGKQAVDAGGVSISPGRFVNSGSPPNLGGFRLSRGGGNMGRAGVRGIPGRAARGSTNRKATCVRFPDLVSMPFKVANPRLCSRDGSPGGSAVVSSVCLGK